MSVSIIQNWASLICKQYMDQKSKRIKHEPSSLPSKKELLQKLDAGTPFCLLIEINSQHAKYSKLSLSEDRIVIIEGE